MAKAAAGVRVPDDVAVVGFDDVADAADYRPPLTTMRQPWPEISATMVDMLLDIIDGTPRESVVLPTTLVVRESA